MTTPQVGTQQVDDRTKPLSIGQWLITFLFLYIPLVNLVFLLYWSLSSSTNINRKNFCIAYIILLGILIGLAILFGVIALVFGLFAEHADTLHGAVHGLTQFYS